MQHHALADLVAFAKVLDQAEVFVPAIGGFDGAEEQKRFLLHYEYSTVNRALARMICSIAAQSVSLQKFKNGNPLLCFQSVADQAAQKSANMG
jgi:hypothetical protein